MKCDNPSPILLFRNYNLIITMQALHSFKSQVFVFVCILCIIACGGEPSVMHVVLPDESCQCVVTTSDLAQLIAYMNQNVISTNIKLTKFEQFAARMENKQNLLLEEIKGLKSRLSAIKDISKNCLANAFDRNYYPVASRLVDRRENATPSVDSATETVSNSNDTKENLTVLLHEVKNMTLEALQENVSIKQELENEKRVRRSLQTRVYIVEEELNQTQSQMQMINEKVIEKDFNNLNSSEEKSIEEMVEEKVLLMFHELDGLNKTDLESKLKTLEYTVNDVHRNGTFLSERLDSFENMMENGTLVKKIDNVTTTLKKFENYEEKINEIGKLRNQVSSINSSLDEKIKEMSKRVMDLLGSEKAELLDLFKGEFLQFNDTWSNRYMSLHEMLSSAVERIDSTNIQTERLLNETEAQGDFTNYTYYETLKKISGVDIEIRKFEKELTSLLPLVAEIDSFKNGFDINAKEIELQTLSENLITQINKELEAAFFNVSDLIESKSFEIENLKNKYERTDLRIKDILSNISSHERKENEKMHELVSQVEVMKKKYDINLDDFGNRLSEIDHYASKQNESIFSLMENIAFVHENQISLDSRLAASLNSMEDMLINEMNSYKENLTLLNEKQVEVMLLLKKMRIAEDHGDSENDTSSMRSRSGGGNVLTKAGEIQTEDIPCTIPLSVDSEMIILDLHEGMVTTTGDTVSDGHQLAFTCKQIGRYVVDGNSSLHCSHGQWNNSFPRCHKLVEETTIREAARNNINPCSKPSGQFPDPADCTKYYNCWEGRKYLQSCPNGLHFNAKVNGCDHARTANCQLRDRKAEMEKLLNIVPPITFDPIQVNGAYSLVASNAIGELVVYPGTNLNLHCLYPRALGEPKWQVEGSSFAILSAWETQGIEDITEAYKLSLHLSSVAEENSGIYTCVTPSGKMHTIKIIVKDTLIDPKPTNRCDKINPIENPRLQVKPDKAFYNIDDVVYFMCDRGFMLVGDAFSRCVKPGKWTSDDFPECVIRI